MNEIAINPVTIKVIPIPLSGALIGVETMAGQTIAIMSTNLRVYNGNWKTMNSITLQVNIHYHLLSS